MTDRRAPAPAAPALALACGACSRDRAPACRDRVASLEVWMQLVAGEGRGAVAEDLAAVPRPPGAGAVWFAVDE